jgi:glutamate carboxypeptidase
MKLNPIYKNIENNRESSFEFLKKIVNIDSFTHDKKGVNEVAQVIIDQMDALGIKYQTYQNEKYGDHIIGTIKGTLPGKILLLGHRDTPHPPGTVKERPYVEKGNIAYGPGVSDMKAGLVSMIMAASAIHKSGMPICDIEILITPDEEYGSPISRSVIEERSKDAVAVFNLESGRPDGSVVTARRGSAHFKFEIKGRASHSGVAIEAGISAIEEAACKIMDLRALNNPSNQISLNVGTINGGTNSNVVAESATGTIHVGYATDEDFTVLTEKIKSIINKSYVRGTKSILTGGEGILPMEKTVGGKQLYKIVKEAAELHGINLTEIEERGAADAGFVASLGVPVICGMGPIGGKWHSVGEYMEIDSFIPRIKMLATSIVLAAEKMN